MIVTSAIASKFDAIAVIALIDYRNSGGPFGADAAEELKKQLLCS